MAAEFTAEWTVGWWSYTFPLQPSHQTKAHWLRKQTDTRARCGQPILDGASVRRSPNGKPKCRRCVRLKG